MARIEGNNVVLETKEENQALLDAIKANLSKKVSKKDEEEIEYSLMLYKSLISSF